MRFEYQNGEVAVIATEGEELTAEQALVLAALEIAKEIKEIDRTLNNSEIAVHRVQ